MPEERIDLEHIFFPLQALAAILTTPGVKSVDGAEIGVLLSSLVEKALDDAHSEIARQGGGAPPWHQAA